jgi:hypothetical protein
MKNSMAVLGYLNKHFETNVIIHEIANDKTKLNFIQNLKNLKITHIFEKSNSQEYHRTRQLNEMLELVNTPVVVNYDIDVLLPVDSYIKASNLIIEGNADVIYPYGFGEYQKMVFNFIDFFNTFELSSINENDMKIWSAKYGHCVFFNTEKYKNMRGENEEFISYGPEDVECFERSVKLDYQIDRINELVYHLEHSRSPSSNHLHKHYNNNNILFNKLTNLNSEQTIEYYKNVDYIKKYKNFKI